MEPVNLTSRTSIAEILALSPQVVRLFVEKRMDCPGCAMAAYCDLEYACKAYDLAMRSMLDEIETACERQPEGSED
ncbi:MAG TPA: hypothetical protein VGK00_11620 [Anaerolineales bacterium]|jgi:hypothetical protein